MQPEHHWHELDGPYCARPNAHQIDEMVADELDFIRSGNRPVPRTSLVIATVDTDELIGVVTWQWESKETNWVSLGIVIFDPDRLGQGLGYEALGSWCQYLFDTLPAIVRLDLRTWSGNHGMMRLAEKLGFSLEARFRMARIVNSEYFDGLGFGVLRTEWETRYPNAFREHLQVVSESPEC
ncbi:MAG: GNAT family N-acetyltransferase [Chloroflexota bacterium]|nr:GNAT family N-acetyltransferase [Chloroflexota bacterium]